MDVSLLWTSVMLGPDPSICGQEGADRRHILKEVLGSSLRFDRE
ncbi:hypothetical protein [Bosea sp. (in: a-proteobacteria)]